jgi:hypothetical protein
MISVGGLPLHVLLVHVVVIMLPLTCAFAILGSIWPAAQRKFTFLTPIGALIGVVAVPLTVAAGQAFAANLGSTSPALARHMTLGTRVLPWAIGLLVVTAVQWAYFQFLQPRRWASVVIAVLVIAVAVGATAQVALTGDSGARAVWEGVLK